MIDKNILSDFGAATSREWLETNGLGGFSSSTVIGLNTRRYHGLLTAATKPPVGRIVMLSKLEETLVVDDQRFDLSANQYPGAVHPQGFRYQTGFRLDPFPFFTYEVAGLRLQKSVFMAHGHNTTVVQYEILYGATKSTSLKLELRPLIAFRDYHSTTHENGALHPGVNSTDGIVSLTPYRDLPTLFLAHDPCEVQITGYWYRNFQYQIEQERGLDSAEDLFNSCCFIFDLTRRKSARLIASTESTNIKQAEKFRKEEINRRRRIAVNPNTKDDFVSKLTAVADQFIVARENGKTVIAGYHWFSDWGRDTMIALPGLTLTTGHPEIAKSILKEFAKHVDCGMLPNRFPDAGETPEYNTVDATLWFFEAVRALLQYTNDYGFVRDELYAVLRDIIQWHVNGTRYNIHVDTDGLLFSGEPGVQLTWMDAKVGDWVITPRNGKAVEIQALWYNALKVMEELALKFENKTEAASYGRLADQAFESFNEQFWNEAAGCLYDVVNGDLKDASIRPNQVLAISLTNSMVSQERAKRILEVVKRDLLTPRGLRTLAPTDRQYRGRYEGDSRSRDSVYHQGTVWPWLMGPYITACVRTFGAEAGRKIAMEWLTQFKGHLSEACLGQISEIYDGNAPHTSRGCVAQAWSVAEILRGTVEAVFAAKNPTSSVRAA